MKSLKKFTITLIDVISKTRSVYHCILLAHFLRSHNIVKNLTLPIIEYAFINFISICSNEKICINL